MAKKRDNSSFDNRLFLAVSDNDRRFGAIYEGLLKHEKFKQLSPTAKWLLVIVATHVTTSKNYRSLYAYRAAEGLEPTELAGNGYFILSSEQLQEYGFPSSHAPRYFKELIGGGFVTVVYHNQHRRRSNVYRLCSAWKK